MQELTVFYRDLRQQKKEIPNRLLRVIFDKGLHVLLAIFCKHW